MRTAEHRSSYPESDAIRLLLILDAAGKPVGDEVPDGAVAVIPSQIAFLARDFWVRYPEYLAEELVRVAAEQRDEHLLTEAEALVDDPLIDVDCLPMVRWRNGAYWWMTNAVAILCANTLVEYRPRPATKGVASHVYFLTKKGRDLARAKVVGEPEFDAIRRRAKLAAHVDPEAPGTQLKDKQYLVDEYARTPPGLTIPRRLAEARVTVKEARLRWET